MKTILNVYFGLILFFIAISAFALAHDAIKKKLKRFAVLTTYGVLAGVWSFILYGLVFWTMQERIM